VTKRLVRPNVTMSLLRHNNVITGSSAWKDMFY